MLAPKSISSGLSNEIWLLYAKCYLYLSVFNFKFFHSLCTRGRTVKHAGSTILYLVSANISEVIEKHNGVVQWKWADRSCLDIYGVPFLSLQIIAIMESLTKNANWLNTRRQVFLPVFLFTLCSVLWSYTGSPLETHLLLLEKSSTLRTQRA